MMKTDKNILDLVVSSASSMEGVTMMAIDAEGLITNPLARDTVSRDGVKLSHEKNGDIVLDVYIRVKYGVKIPQLAWELQRKIQNDILLKQKITLSDINIHVEGVDMGELHDQI